MKHPCRQLKPHTQQPGTGCAQMDTWYYSPYPEPYASLEKLHVCEFCLKYFGKEKTLIRHMAKCEMRHPPGDEIYRSPPEPKSPGHCKTPIAVFEVCGKTNKVSCASLHLCIHWQRLRPPGCDL